MPAYLLDARHVVDLADGRTVAPGEVVKNVDEKDPHNKRLIDEGFLVEHIDSKASTRRKTDKEGDR